MRSECSSRGPVLDTREILQTEWTCENTSSRLLFLVVPSYSQTFIAHLHIGEMSSVRKILIFISWLVGFCLQALHRSFVSWTNQSLQISPRTVPPRRCACAELSCRLRSTDRHVPDPNPPHPYCGTDCSSAYWWYTGLAVGRHCSP